MTAQSTTNVFKQAAGASIGWGVVMIVLGCLALCLPFATGIGVSPTETSRTTGAVGISKA